MANQLSINSLLTTLDSKLRQSENELVASTIQATEELTPLIHDANIEVAPDRKGVHQIEDITLKKHHIEKIAKSICEQNSSSLRLLSTSSECAIATYSVKLGMYLVIVKVVIVSQVVDSKSTNIPIHQAQFKGYDRKHIAASLKEIQSLEDTILLIAIAKLCSAMGIGLQICTQLPFDAVVYQNALELFVESSLPLNQVAPNILNQRLTADLGHCMAVLQALNICIEDAKFQDFAWSRNQQKTVLSNFKHTKFRKHARKAAKVTFGTSQSTIINFMGKLLAQKYIKLCDHDALTMQTPNITLHFRPFLDIALDEEEAPVVKYGEELKLNTTRSTQSLSQNSKHSPNDCQGTKLLSVAYLTLFYHASSYRCSKPIELEQCSKFLAQQEIAQLTNILVRQARPTKLHQFMKAIQNIKDPIIQELWSEPGKQIAEVLQTSRAKPSCFEIEPKFTHDMIQRGRRIFGRHAPLKKIESALRTGSKITRGSHFLNEYYKLTHIRTLGIGLAAETNLRKIKSCSNSEIVNHKNFEVLTNLLISGYNLSRPFREDILADLSRCISCEKKLSYNDQEFLIVLTKTLSRDMRHSELYSYLADCNELERCVLLAVLYGTLGPNDNDPMEIVQFEQKLTLLLHIVLIPLSKSFPMYAAETFQLLKLVVKNLGTKPPKAVETRFYQLCFKLLQTEDNSEDPLCILSRLNIKIFKASLNPILAETLEELTQEVYEFNSYHCEILPPWECFPLFEIIQKSIPLHKQPTESIDSIRMRRFLKDTQSDRFNNVIYHFYRALSSAQISFNVKDWILGERMVNEAQRLYRENPNKLRFLDWAQLQLTKTFILRHERRYEQTDVLVTEVEDKLQQYLGTNKSEVLQESQEVRQLTKSILQTKMDTNARLGKFTAALFDSACLDRQPETLSDDFAELMMQQASLSVEMGSFKKARNQLLLLHRRFLQKKNPMKAAQIALELAKLHFKKDQLVDALKIAELAVTLLLAHPRRDDDLLSSAYLMMATIAHHRSDWDMQADMFWKVLQFSPNLKSTIAQQAIQGIDRIQSSHPTLQSIVNHIGALSDPENSKLNELIGGEKDRLQRFVEELKTSLKDISSPQHSKYYLLKQKLLFTLKGKVQLTLSPPEFPLPVVLLELILEMALHILFASGLQNLKKHLPQLQQQMEQIKMHHAHQQMKKQLKDYLSNNICARNKDVNEERSLQTSLPSALQKRYRDKQIHH